MFMDKMAPDILRLSVMDNDIDLFEGQYPVPQGVSYNTYLIEDDQLCLLDTVDARKQEEWLAGLDEVLAGRKLDYLVISHMEPDHAGSIAALCARQPQLKLVANARTFAILDQFSGDAPLAQERVTVADGGTLALGSHTLHFVLAPMVHWPEVMVEYEESEKILFSADGFGKFGALAHDEDWTCEARRYYFNIVGKYGAPVQALLQKAAGLKLQRICPLHGPVWRRDLGVFLDKYQKWSTYTPEEKGVVIAYASIYGNTELACQALANALSEEGVRDVRMYDVSVTDSSEILSEAFRRSHLVLASVTFNGGLFPNMEKLLLELRSHGLKNRTVALMENGTWAPVSGRKMQELLSGMAVTVLDQKITLSSTLKQGQLAEIRTLAKTIAQQILA